jgi:hypothetical protein
LQSIGVSAKSAKRGVARVRINEPVDLLRFTPISSLFVKNIPWNINYIPVDIFPECLDLELKPY